MTTTVTTTVVAGTGAPAVDVVVVWTTGPTTVTIERNVAGAWTPLRFGNPATLVANTVTVRDYEVPDNTSVTYRAYPVGAVGSAVTSTPAVTVPERGAWLIHPAFPDTLSAGPLITAANGWPKWTRAARQDVAQILGVATPVVVDDVRGSRVGTWSIILQSAAEATTLDTLLTSTRVMLLNTNRYPAPYVWVAVGDETWTPLTPRIAAATTPLWQVDLPLLEVARPDVTSSGEVTWLDVSARYATFDLLAARYTTFDAFWVDAATWTS